MMRLNCYLNRKVLCQIAIIFHFFAKIFAYFKKILYLCIRVSQNAVLGRANSKRTARFSLGSPKAIARLVLGRAKAIVRFMAQSAIR